MLGGNWPAPAGLEAGDDDDALAAMRSIDTRHKMQQVSMKARAVGGR